MRKTLEVERPHRLIALAIAAGLALNTRCSAPKDDAPPPEPTRGHSSDRCLQQYSFQQLSTNNPSITCPKP